MGGEHACDGMRAHTVTNVDDCKGAPGLLTTHGTARERLDDNKNGRACDNRDDRTVVDVIGNGSGYNVLVPDIGGDMCVHDDVDACDNSDTQDTDGISRLRHIGNTFAINLIAQSGGGCSGTESRGYEY